MSWRLSRFRKGDRVEVRSKEEILATLDRHGCVDGMPFMPEMLVHCGRRFRVEAVAHKTCDTVRQTGGRSLDATVHLTGLCCDGSAHGGCQAQCNLFWKDVWLKPVDVQDERPAAMSPAGNSLGPGELHALTQRAGDTADDTRYVCQATQLHEATRLLRWWSPRQYVRDVVTGNHSWRHATWVLLLAMLRAGYEHTPIAYRLLKWTHDSAHRLFTGRHRPDVQGAIPRGHATPTGRLDLRPGERVRIKSKEEIVRSVDRTGKNRGLSFDPEMTPFCGQVVAVRASVTQIIHEPSGRMIQMKQPCIMLEGVACNAEYSHCRLLCPRAIPSYWREIWLERVEAPSPVAREVDRESKALAAADAGVAS